MERREIYCIMFIAIVINNCLVKKGYFRELLYWMHIVRSFKQRFKSQNNNTSPMHC